MNNNRYGHIVYTRRGAGWDMDGKPVSSEGYGIYAASGDVFAGVRDKDLQNLALTHKHNRDAYTYFVPGKGSAMLGAYHYRTADELEVASNAGVDSRQVTISEWLVGDFVRYPFEYIDSPFWKQIKRPIPEFYANESPMPMESPLEADSVPVSALTREAVMNFVKDGRVEAVKAAVWALMKQFDLPAAERKFIVIRDTEANVRKWVAAIGYNFPVRAACEISFNTSMSDLNQEPACSYYIQKNTGAYVKIRNIQDPNQERRCVYMIAGADPADRTSDRTANPPQNAPYIVIDGAAKQAKFPTDELMQRAFLKNVAVNDAAIDNFCNFMNEMQDVSMGTAICDLFDAQRMVENEAGWSYSALCNALELLAPHFTRSSVLMRFVVDRLCVAGAYVNRFAREDEQNQLKLYRMLYRFIRDFGISDAASAMKGIAVKRVGALLGNPAEVAMLTTYTGCLKDTDEKLYVAAIKEVVGANKLAVVTDRNIASGPNEYIVKVFEVIDAYLAGDVHGWSGFFNSPDFARTANQLIARSTQDQALTSRVLRILSGDARAVDRFILQGFKLSGGQGVRWWRTVLENSITPDHLCSLINDNNLGADEIEKVLCTEISLHGYRDVLSSLYKQYLAKLPGMGSAFYAEWIKSIPKGRNMAAGLKRPLTEMAANPGFARQFSQTIVDIDKQISFERSGSVEDVVELLDEFAPRAKVRCVNADLWSFLNKMITTKIGRRDKDGVAGLFLSANPGAYRYTAPRNLMLTPMGKEFMERMEEFITDPAGHIIAMCAFTLGDAGATRAYIEDYAKLICTDTAKKKTDALTSVIYLREMLADGSETNDLGTDKLVAMYKPGELLRQMDDLLSACQKELCEFKTDGITDKLVTAATKDYGKRTAKMLEKMLREAQEVYKENHKGVNIFSKLFAGLKKK